LERQAPAGNDAGIASPFFQCATPGPAVAGVETLAAGLGSASPLAALLAHPDTAIAAPVSAIEALATERIMARFADRRLCKVQLHEHSVLALD
jgi:hypothetical protein